MSFTEKSINSIDKILESTNYDEIKNEINNLIKEDKINPTVFKHLQTVLINLDCDTNLLNTIGILSLSTSIPELKNAVFFKLIELLRLSKMSNLKEICYLIIYSKFLIHLTSKSYFPELIKTIQNILILFSKEKNSKLFLPIYKLQKLKDKNSFLNINEESIEKFELIKFNLKHITTIDFKNLENENQLKISLLNEVLELIKELKIRYKELEAFESIFYFINKLTNQLKLDYPFLNDQFTKLLELDLELKPKLSHLILPRQKPNIISMFEPDYNSDLLSQKRRQQSAKDIERNIRKKLKRELKSTQREIKKDNAFINSIKLEETLEKDRERKEKVKKLISEIQEERSMFKK